MAFGYRRISVILPFLSPEDPPTGHKNDDILINLYHMCVYLKRDLSLSISQIYLHRVIVLYARRCNVQSNLCHSKNHLLATSRDSESKVALSVALSLIDGGESSYSNNKICDTSL